MTTTMMIAVDGAGAVRDAIAVYFDVDADVDFAGTDADDTRR